jgi:hypothetical protein
MTELPADYERLQKKVANLQRKVARLEQERDWAVRDRESTHHWAKEAWMQVDWLRRLCERYYEAGVRVDLPGEDLGNGGVSEPSGLGNGAER